MPVHMYNILLMYHFDLISSHDVEFKRRLLDHLQLMGRKGNMHPFLKTEADVLKKTKGVARSFLAGVPSGESYLILRRPQMLRAGSFNKQKLSVTLTLRTWKRLHFKGSKGLCWEPDIQLWPDSAL